MCGIVGYVGAEQAAPILLDGLSRLEYRGYDSAGVAIYSQGKVRVAKAKGRLQVLSDMIQGGRAIQGTIGIGHTRWATHGAPSDVNSHPHVSHSGNIAVVHNGIIENYAELKSFLQSKGVPFVSETDSEVVAQLVEYFYQGDLLEAVGRVLHRIQGAYALGILCCDQPDQLIAVRKDSPLILGLAEGANFLASDVTAILRHTRDVIYMEDGEVAVLTSQGVQCYNSLLQPITKEVSQVDWEVDAAEKGGYEHFMFKEIMEQPQALRRAVFPRIQDGEVYLEDFALTDEDIRGLSKVYVVACGSSYHVGMVGKYHLERLLRKPVEVALASEFRYMEPIVDEHTLVIVISQSGETLDTMAALREAKRLGAKVLAIVNVVGSSIAREADEVLYTWAGPEIAVATTKAYTTQLAVLNLLGLYMARRLGTVADEEYTQVLEQMLLLPAQMEEVLEKQSQIQYLASQYFNHESIFFMGRNVDYTLGLEGSLKLKEISYIHSEAYAAGELKHGTISLIEDGTLVVAVGTYGPLFDKALSNVVEVKSRGASVLALTTQSQGERMAEVANDLVTIPDTHPLLLPSLGVVPLQLFAYYVALHRGCDIDKPRNLAKSVTVE
ncbi:glutamine--fructose-6-phosphate transaminase (isomerizing) [Pseudoflavonifractor sp. An85]|uniref:glutamine--fructose-6-phosphate transaminase (isomerizing) n=1 Tax=Pseudoflavonifractor sp. An85 TaxID=1965661 RepID=UPI000B39B6D0|nr:glutamine--fructose-6-phosphate transaminase (isomerizing) [Pseudoflavonifractor sp. An85]OUN26043.1 glutamine--fructose-6-phosphate transaminase (isomerizing) [Pseudoflavonifractor sp. An85]